MRADMDKIKTVAERYGIDPNINVDVVDRHTIDVSFPDGRVMRCVNTSSLGTLVTTPIDAPSTTVTSSFIDFCNELFPTLNVERDMSDIKFDKAVRVPNRTAAPELAMLNERLAQVWGAHEVGNIRSVAFWPEYLQYNYGYQMSISTGGATEVYVKFMSTGDGDEVIPFFAPAFGADTRIDGDLKSFVIDVYSSISYVFGVDTLDQIRQLTICPVDDGRFKMVLEPSVTPNGLGHTSKFVKTLF